MSGDDVHKLISIDDDVKNSVPIALYRLRSGSLLNTAVEVEVDKAVSTAVATRTERTMFPAVTRLICHSAMIHYLDLQFGSVLKVFHSFIYLLVSISIFDATPTTIW